MHSHAERGNEGGAERGKEGGADPGNEVHPAENLLLFALIRVHSRL